MVLQRDSTTNFEVVCDVDCIDVDLTFQRTLLLFVIWRETSCAHFCSELNLSEHFSN